MWTGKNPAEDLASLTVLEKHIKAMSRRKDELTTHVVHAWYSMHLKVLPPTKSQFYHLQTRTNEHGLENKRRSLACCRIYENIQLSFLLNVEETEKTLLLHQRAAISIPTPLNMEVGH